ncbi:hypothetical protein [Curtobacterium oceanosedimentum]|uniref:hypothetical protein n=1 Tax=Curtobacterium oceanosedimentum TaxID=465820 RepID=UPI001AE53354
MLLLSAVTTVGCAGQRGAAPSTERTTPVDADTAQRTMIDVVDQATAALGGEWETRTSPDYVESCQLSSNGEGARWVYRVARSESGDAEADAVAASGIWRSDGMRVDRLVDAKGPAMVARGGDRVDTIRFFAFPGNDSIQALSLCIAGDADEIEEQQADG